MIKNMIASLVITALAFGYAEAKQERSEAAKNDFKFVHPCPSNGKRSGPCPGYVIDHIKPLACGGADAPFNMQWQTVDQGKAKDKWERKDCELTQDSSYKSAYKSRSSSGSYSSSNSIHNPSTSYSSSSTTGMYVKGPRGGCYYLNSGGNKQYVDRSLCR